MTINMALDHLILARPMQLISIIEELQLALDCHHQVDLLMLDFSKAFDTVPHLHLLKYYGINGKLCYWLSTWLTKRSQRVIVDGYESKYARVISGVPQGTVLGPVMFLLYINNAKQKQPGCKKSARPIRSHNGYKRPKSLISSKAKKLNILLRILLLE